jgi:phosphatidylglycerophosphate synthase
MDAERMGAPRVSLATALGTGMWAGAIGWVVLAHPRWSVPLLAWFCLLVAVSLMLPGAANQVTLARAYLAGPAFVYAVAPSGLGALAAVVAMAGFSDLLDGAVARRMRTTRLGGGLDPVTDGIFFGAVAIGLAVGGAYPVWVAAVVVLRYLVPALAGAALLLLHRPVQLRHTPVGQVSTLLIGVVLGGVALLRGLGFDATWLLLTGMVVVPVTTLGTWANLFWANREAFASSKRDPTR